LLRGFLTHALCLKAPAKTTAQNSGIKHKSSFTEPEAKPPTYLVDCLKTGTFIVPEKELKLIAKPSPPDGGEIKEGGRGPLAFSPPFYRGTIPRAGQIRPCPCALF
jgi:hypothetical protein